MMHDPIADMLTQIRNALKVARPEVVLPYSKMKQAIAQILQQEGYLEKVEKLDDSPARLKLALKYQAKRQPAISSLKRISKPGRRVYVTHDRLPWVLNNYGIAVVSTSRGVMTNHEARQKRIGGEIICEVY